MVRVKRGKIQEKVQEEVGEELQENSYKKELGGEQVGELKEYSYE